MGDGQEQEAALTIEAEDEEAEQEEAALMIADAPFKKELAFQKQEAFKKKGSFQKQEDFRKRGVAGDVAFVAGAFRIPTQHRHRAEEGLAGLVCIMKGEDEDVDVDVEDFVEEGGINGLARQ